MYHCPHFETRLWKKYFFDMDSCPSKFSKNWNLLLLKHSYMACHTNIYLLYYPHASCVLVEILHFPGWPKNESFLTKHTTYMDSTEGIYTHIYSTILWYMLAYIDFFSPEKSAKKCHSQGHKLTMQFQYFQVL